MWGRHWLNLLEGKLVSETAIDGKIPKKKIDYWVAPMDASYRRDEPGKSPMGMVLIPVYESGGNDEPGTVTISPNIENSLVVQLGEASLDDLSLKINTVGFIQFNEEAVSHAHSRVEGWIESLSVNAVGDPVEKGQKLFANINMEYPVNKRVKAHKILQDWGKFKQMKINVKKAGELRREAVKLMKEVAYE